MNKKIRALFEAVDQIAVNQSDSWQTKIDDLSSTLKENTDSFVYFSRVRPHHAVVAVAPIVQSGKNRAMAYWRPFEHDCTRALSARGETLHAALQALAVLVDERGKEKLGQYVSDHSHFAIEVLEAVKEFAWIEGMRDRVVYRGRSYFLAAIDVALASPEFVSDEAFPGIYQADDVDLIVTAYPSRGWRAEFLGSLYQPVARPRTSSGSPSTRSFTRYFAVSGSPRTALLQLRHFVSEQSHEFFQRSYWESCGDQIRALPVSIIARLAEAPDAPRHPLMADLVRRELDEYVRDTRAISLCEED